MRHAAAIRAVGCHRVIGIRNVNDAGIDGALFSFLSVRVARSIPVLVMQFDCTEVRYESLDTFENPSTDNGVLLNQSKFLGGETPGLLQDAIGDADLSNVMKKRAD